MILSPDAPKVIMPSITPGYYLQKGELTCQVDSLIPFTVRFNREAQHLGVDQIFRCIILTRFLIFFDVFKVTFTLQVLWHPTRPQISLLLCYWNSESSNVSWEISQVSLKDEGFYDCIAISSAGTGQARTFLDVSGENQWANGKRKHIMYGKMSVNDCGSMTCLTLSMFVCGIFQSSMKSPLQEANLWSV